MKLSKTLLIATALVGLAPSLAQAAPKLLATDRHSGNILEFTAQDGGDISANVFASGLSEPVSICIGPNNDIYVSELTSGEITIVTAGGDMSAEPAFAGLPPMSPQLSPTGLWCNEDSVIVGDLSGGVLDVTVGGEDLAQWGLHVIYSQDPTPTQPFDLLRDGSGDFLASSNIGILDANVGADGNAAPLVPAGAGMENGVALAVVGTTLLAANITGNNIYDFTSAVDFGVAPDFATVPVPTAGGVIGLYSDADMGVFAATEDGIFDVTGGGDFTAATPIATGFATPTPILIVDMTFHDCSTDEECADDDLCNGDEVCLGGRCGPPTEPLDCDDDDVCTADTCDAAMGCDSAPIDNCCISDLECEIDEICDLEDNECVPASSPTSGSESDSDSDSDGESSSTTDGETDGDTIGTTGAGSSSTTASTSTSGVTTTAGGTESGGDTDTDTDGAGADSDSGCSCSASPEPVPSALLLGLFALGLVRRRQR